MTVSTLRSTLSIWTLLTTLLLAGCPSSSTPSVELRGHRFSVEIAETDETRQRGLMFRDELAEDWGMLFIFPEEQPLSFWMMNTRIPLDILYFNRDWRLVGMHQDVPPCRDRVQCPSYPSGALSKYALELNAGTARRLGVQLGDTLDLQRPR